MIARTLLAVAALACAFFLGTRTAPSQPVPAELLARLERVEAKLASDYPRHDAPVKGAAAAAAVPTAPPVPTLTAEQEASVRAGNAIVDNALVVGHWTDEDVAAMEAATGDLDGSERVKILRRVAAAINADRLQLDTHRMPF